MVYDMKGQTEEQKRNIEARRKQTALDNAKIHTINSKGEEIKGQDNIIEAIQSQRSLASKLWQKVKSLVGLEDYLTEKEDQAMKIIKQASLKEDHTISIKDALKMSNRLDHPIVFEEKHNNIVALNSKGVQIKGQVAVHQEILNHRTSLIKASLGFKSLTGQRQNFSKHETKAMQILKDSNNPVNVKNNNIVSTQSALHTARRQSSGFSR
jgi:hypothetical protein